MRQRSQHQAKAATVAEGGARARTVQGSARQLLLCKELFFAGFPCAQPYGVDGTHGSTTTTPSSSPSSAPRPLSSNFVRGFFQQYGPVESLFYDAQRGMGSVVFADGADAEGCYLAVHLSFLPQTTADGGLGKATWEQDEQGEAMAERRARAEDALLCLEFAHCCPFVNPVLLTRDVFVEGGSACCEVPGGELSKATLFHRFPELLTAENAKEAKVPVAPHVVMRWKAKEEEEEEEQRSSQSAAAASRVEVIEESDEDLKEARNQNGEEESSTVKKDGEGRTKKTKEEGDNTATATAKRTRLTPVGPSFPGRGIQPVEIEKALWQLLRPSHLSAPSLNTTVTVMDLWWEYYNTYMLHKTQPAPSRIADEAFRYAGRRSAVQDMLEVQRQGRAYAHGDDAAAQQVLQRLLHDHTYHNVLSYVTVKQKFKYDPVWASLMRDVYKPKVALHLEAWQALMTEKDEKEAAQSTEKNQKDSANATPAAKTVADTEVRRRRIVIKAIRELVEPAPTKPQDVAWVRKAEQTWFELPRTTAASNVMENVRFLCKVQRGEVDRNGHDRKPSSSAAANTTAAVADDDPPSSSSAAYPSMTSRQKDEQFYAEVLRNIDGYVATGTADELVSLCEDPKLFRYAKGHIGYEAVRSVPSYWLAYLNALWVPLITLCLLGFGTYYVVDRLGISKVNEMKMREAQRQEFLAELQRMLDTQERLRAASVDAEDPTQVRNAVRELNESMHRASEAAKRVGGRFNIEMRNDL